ncbi:hypothetical protein DFH06DRAFT_1320723 [Mycena polygramma]|nr:hypothetical protein DFH06DRAFT_1320723 [Mycena polygramma]
MSDTAPTALPQSALPTFHAAAHSPRCALESPYLAGTAGVTDGESVERFWALAGPTATSTRNLSTRHLVPKRARSSEGSGKK